ncbi:hypothetical protein A6E15_18205 [Natrinema saccharevitans]|uniref:CAAX prenyl protease 2/Lysostaphin resistance protein A-like domain-containing protein n=1 Tax=Natrinema saccharevitans TaxID=301967 RepID=A0A1S8ARG0_9EURY|nr:type II CAAX endopeptidase family protein [Natrinema saccharevitans]OLZ39325.1 hypothetical protein A6E15_18205 [Natrinema saccharevitans]
MSPQLPVELTAPTGLRQAWQYVTWPVWNHDHHRLRAPFRAIIPVIATFLALAIVQSVVRSQFEHPVRESAEMIGIAGVLIGAVLVSSRLIDRRPATEYGLSFNRQWLQMFAVGGLAATLINAGAVAVGLGAGWVTVAGIVQTPGVISFLPAMVVVFGYIMVAGLWEEFIFRGVLLKNIAEGVNGYVRNEIAIGIALAINCIVFAFLHGGKVTHLSHYGYYLLAGLVLGGVYVLTGELALSMGFHIFYNYTQSAVFGLGVSQQTPELLVLNLVGPTQYIGEEGLVHVGATAVGGLLLLGYVYWMDGELRIHDCLTRWTSTV